METITIGQIAQNLALIAGIITAGGAIYQFTSKRLGKTLQEALDDAVKPTNDRLKAMEKKLENLDLSDCKNYMVQFLARAEKTSITDEETARFWEIYDKYTEMGGNSYIHEKVEKLKKAGKL